MRELEQVLALFVAAVVLAGAARRVGAPYPVFLALGGAVLALLPTGATFALPPELALALFVAPVLLDAGVRHVRPRPERELAADCGSCRGCCRVDHGRGRGRRPVADARARMGPGDRARRRGVWIFAESLGLSGVLTMVCYAMAVARTAPERTPARMRIPTYAVWETVVFALNILAFIFIGLQIRPILESLAAAERGRYFAVAGAVLLTVILVRLAWHMSFNAVVEVAPPPVRVSSAAADAAADRRAAAWSSRGRACAALSRSRRLWRSRRRFRIAT